MPSPVPEHFCNRYVEGIDAHTDSWWNFVERDVRKLAPWRLHASFINSSYRRVQYQAHLCWKQRRICDVFQHFALTFIIRSVISE